MPRDSAFAGTTMRVVTGRRGARRSGARLRPDARSRSRPASACRFPSRRRRGGVAPRPRGRRRSRRAGLRRRRATPRAVGSWPRPRMTAAVGPLTALPAMSGDTATTGRGAVAQARAHARQREDGLDAERRVRGADDNRLQRRVGEGGGESGAGRGPGGAFEIQRRDGRARPVAHEIVLEGEPSALRSVDEGGRCVVAHRRDAVGDSQALRPAPR